MLIHLRSCDSNYLMVNYTGTAIEKIEAKVKIAVAEVPGRSWKKRLQISDPFKGKKCEDPDKIMVWTGGGRGCRSNGVACEVNCKKCGDCYVGETGRNAYTRGLEHLRGDCE